MYKAKAPISVFVSFEISSTPNDRREMIFEMKTMDFSTKQAMFHQHNHYSRHLLFEARGKQLLDSLNIAPCNPNVVIASQEINTEMERTTLDAVSSQEVQLVVSDYMMCNCCQTHFADRQEQRGHYKCDWHRYNLHQRLKGLPCVSEEEFEAVAGDVSSISGSDDEYESDDAAKAVKLLESDTSVAETPDIEDEGNAVLADRKFYKVFFKTKEGELISLFRCLLHDKKNPLCETDILAAVRKLPEKKRWIILMVSSGHFAGTVFHGNEVIDHKTFHRYTVRAKRGTAQSTKDSQGGAPKSAGATLRRYNESALVQDVQDLLSRWEEKIGMCDFVFVRIPVANRGMFFGGKNPAFRKDDSRIRVIPFPTRRPTFSETKRVQKMLSSIECYGQEADIGDIFPVSPSRIYNNDTGQLILRKDGMAPKSGKEKNKKQPMQEPVVVDAEKHSAGVEEGSDFQDKVIEMDLVETFEEIDFSELKQFDSTVKRKQKKKKPLPTEKQNMPRDVLLDKEMAEMRNSLFTACKKGYFDSVQTCLEAVSKIHTPNVETFPVKAHENDTTLHSQNSEVNGCISDVSVSEISFVSNTLRDDHSIQQPADTTQVVSSHNQHLEQSLIASTDSSKIASNVSSLLNFLNMPLSNDGTTFLHVAAKEGHADVVTALLSSGADPAIKNKDGKTAYNLGESEVRNAFRRFMAKFPDQYDYIKAQIPGPLTEEMEAEKKLKAAEKRKAKKKAMNERQKDKKAIEAKIREENQERDRFLALSDREKRALAAEKRILQQCNNQGLSQPVMSRCYQCGTDITGKVPFEYSDYKFCTTKCLREHRSKPSA